MKKLIIVVGAGVIGAVLISAFVDASVVTINAGEVGVLLTFGQANPNPRLLLFSQVAYAISYTKYLNGTMTITYDNGTTVTPSPESALYKAHNHESLN